MQTRRMSAVESVTSVLAGFLISVAANMVVLPIFGHSVTVGDSFAIGGIFTIISLARSYAIRRAFNAIEGRHVTQAT